MASDLQFNDLRSIVLGDLIGEGSARKVYQLNLNAQFVIKVEELAKSFQNVCEWEMWKYVEDTPLAKWFAPCVKISNSGIFLVQYKVDPIRISEQPRKLPWFLCDIKRENFGLLNGKLVCCDYGTMHSFIARSRPTLRKADWR